MFIKGQSRSFGCPAVFTLSVRSVLFSVRMDGNVTYLMLFSVCHV